jgi:hypothetical protein
MTLGLWQVLRNPTPKYNPWKQNRCQILLKVKTSAVQNTLKRKWKDRAGGVAQVVEHPPQVKPQYYKKKTSHRLVENIHKIYVW